MGKNSHLRREWEKFFKFLNQQVYLGSGLILILFLLLLLPSPGYYQRWHSFWQPERVGKLEVEMPVYPYPVNKTKKEPPAISARSAVVIDVDSGMILYGKNPHLRLFPASTTKIMTALVALESYSLDQVLTVGRLEKNGQAIGLLPGEQITVRALLYGLLVASGNDAAVVLAQNFPGGRERFVQAMNDKAQQWGLTDTHFTNASGVEHTHHYSTAWNLARLSLIALKNPVFAQMVATKKITVWDSHHQIPHHLVNLNRLLSKKKGILGVKTGWTQQAGECLIAYVKRGERRLLSVVLGSQDRFRETEKMTDWVLENFQWKRAI